MKNNIQVQKIKSVKKIYFNSVSFLIFAFAWFGFGLPALLSAKSDIMVLTGIMVTVGVVIPWLAISGLMIFNKIKEGGLR